MTTATVGYTIEKALSDEAFAVKLLTDPDNALADVKGSLTPEESAALKALSPELLNGIDDVLSEEQDKRKWWQPSGFKEFGAAVLSLLLVFLLFYAIAKMFGLINTVPQVLTVGETVQVVDTYDRAKNLLLILFPLFSAVISFWLGVAVEGRRADANEAQAENESVKREAAEYSEADIRQQAAASLGLVEGKLVAMAGTEPDAASPFETTGAESTAQQMALGSLLQSVREAQSAIRR